MDYAVAHLDDAVRELAERHCGVVRRDQLQLLRIGADRVAHEVGMQRWRPWGPRVVVLQNTPPTPDQLKWAGVLHCGGEAALAGLTALAESGVTGFETPVVHVVVRRGHKVPYMPGLKVHESRRFEAIHAHPARLPQQVPATRAAIDAACWQRVARRGCAILAATVQQRVALPEHLREELDNAGQVRHRHVLRLSLDDIEGGSHSLGEIDVMGLCRRHGLSTPVRQRVRRDRDGRRRYLDVEWQCQTDGSWRWRSTAATICWWSTGRRT